MKYIIDGYNVTHQIEQLKGKRLRSQREGLVRLLEMAQAQDKKFRDLTVVFDGQNNVFAPRVYSSVKIVFSKGKSADKKIKQILESSSYARDVTVVSDDREISSFAGRLRAKRISVEEFLKKILHSGKESHSFKLDQAEVKKINQELEKIWIEKPR